MHVLTGIDGGPARDGLAYNMEDDCVFELVESFVYGVLSGNVKLILTYESGYLNVKCFYSVEDPVYTKYKGGESMERDPKRMKTSVPRVKRRKTMAHSARRRKTLACDLTIRKKLAPGPVSSDFIFSSIES